MAIFWWLGGISLNPLEDEATLECHSWIYRSDKALEVCILYRFLLSNNDSNDYQHNCIQCIKDIFISVGRVDLLHEDFIKNHNSIKMQISQTYHSQYSAKKQSYRLGV